MHKHRHTRANQMPASLGLQLVMPGKDGRAKLRDWLEMKGGTYN